MNEHFIRFGIDNLVFKIKLYLGTLSCYMKLTNIYREKNMKKGFKFLAYAAMAAVLMTVAMDPAMAQGLNRVTGTVKDQMPGVVDILSAIAYIAGVGFGIKAALKLKEHNESKGQIPLSQPITLGIVAALLLALPTFLSVAKEGVFGTGSTGTSISGETLRQVN